MSRKSLSFLLVIASSVTLFGCNRGCTTSKTIASESTTVSTSGGNVQVTGRVIDYRHSKRQSSDIFDRKVSHSYGLSFDLNYGTFAQREFYHEGVDDPEKVNLTKELQRVKVEISKDQNHIGLGVDGKVVEIIHLYKSNRISTNRIELLADGTMDWSKLDMESYPSPESILTESLKNSCDDIGGNDNAYFEFCNTSKPSAKIHKIMLDQWPKCNTAENYYTENKIRELSKSKKWRKRAEKRAKLILDNLGSYSFEFDAVMAFIDALDSDNLNTQLNGILLDKWGGNGTMDFTSVLVKRIKENKNSFSYSDRQVLRSEAKMEFSKFEKSGQFNYKRKGLECLRVLSALGDTTTAYKFIQNSFGKNASRFDSRDFLDVAYGDFNLYTAHQQQLIIQKTEATFASFKGSYRSSYYYAIDDLVDCSMLKRLKNKYPDDLHGPSVPMRCR